MHLLCSKKGEAVAQIKPLLRAKDGKGTSVGSVQFPLSFFKN